MKSPTLAWARNLPEVGAPIRDAASRIESELAEANADLAAARAAHKERLAAIRQSARSLEKSIARFWSPAEVDAAKRGFLLVDGREIPVD
jgi:xanthine dehydrogenase iron-sulfur cluster and FAD-binding subunit A